MKPSGEPSTSKQQQQQQQQQQQEQQQQKTTVNNPVNYRINRVQQISSVTAGDEGQPFDSQLRNNYNKWYYIRASLETN